MAMKTTEAKAIRLVVDDAVSVEWWNDDAGAGKVKGDTATYDVSFSPAGRICNCPAGSNGRNCSHGIALELAVAQLKEDEWQSI